MKLAVIPARGGSKRIPRKNIKPFCGMPMIGWSIKAALNSGCFDSVIVSTDDEEIATVARSLGASVPFLRPQSLSDDYTPTVPVIQHAISWQTERGNPPDEVCCIYATAPFVERQDIQRGYRLLVQGGYDYTFSATTYAFPVQRALRLRENGCVEMLNPQHANTRSQDLEAVYHDAGQFYWGTSSAWKLGKPVFLSNSAVVLLPRYRVQDIDTPEDWLQAEWLFKALQGLEL